MKPEAQEVKIIRSKGITSVEVIKERLILLVKSRLSGKAVLHTLDQVAGGAGDEFGDSKGIFGDSNVNSSLGSQWTSSERLGKIEKAVSDISPDSYPKEKMKVELTPKRT
jgi:Novel toxin 15